MNQCVAFIALPRAQRLRDLAGNRSPSAPSTDFSVQIGIIYVQRPARLLRGRMGDLHSDSRSSETKVNTKRKKITA